MSSLDSKGFRQALGQFVTGVTIVTTIDENDQPIGITANSFSSVSLEPPLVLWSLSTNASSKKAFSDAKYFGVHVLTSTQQELSDRFATTGIDKFSGIEWSLGLGSVPLLREYVALFQCRTAHQFPVGDHIIFVGEVLQFCKTNKRPLVFHGGRYALAERRIMADIARQVGEDTGVSGERREANRKDSGQK